MDSDEKAALAAIILLLSQKIFNVKKGGRERNGLNLDFKGEIHITLSVTSWVMTFLLHQI